MMVVIGICIDVVRNVVVLINVYLLSDVLGYMVFYSLLSMILSSVLFVRFGVSSLFFVLVCRLLVLISIFSMSSVVVRLIVSVLLKFSDVGFLLLLSNCGNCIDSMLIIVKLSSVNIGSC